MSSLEISYKKPLLETPFHKRTSEHCYSNDWYRWAGYKVAKEYSSTELEYTSMRNTAGVIDITPMHKYEIKGDEAKKFINKLITKDISNIKSNQVAYGIWCNEDGMVIDDGTIFCFNENHFRIFCAERNLNWFSDTATGFNVSIEDISPSIAALAFQGPLSCKILNLLKVENIENLKPFHFNNYNLENNNVTISRTGFSGDLGYEIWCEPSQAIEVWDSLFKFNRDYKVLAAGMNALEMVRVEAGFIQPNADFMSAEQALRPNRMRNPYELGLGWLVNLEKDYLDADISIISPKNKEKVLSENFMISLSYFGMANMDLDNIKIFVDDIDVSSLSQIRKNNLVYIPSNNLKNGKHNIKVVLKTHICPFHSL